MAPDLESLPPEIILHIAGFLDRHDLSSLTRVATFLHVILGDLLYKREVAEGRLAGLVHSIRRGRATAVAKFIAAGADVNAMIDMSPDIEDFFGPTTALATAVVRGRREIAKLLLDQGAEPEARFPGLLCYTVLDHDWAGAAGQTVQTPLSVALVLGHTDIAVDLVTRMHNPDAVVSTLGGVGFTVLEQAVLLLRVEVVRQLLEQGADPNRRRRPHSLVVLHALLEQFDLPGGLAGNPDGETMLLKTILTLLEQGADPFAKRSCMTHVGNTNHPEEGCECDLTACGIGQRSPYWRVRVHFADIAQRQQCSKLACGGSRDRHGMTREEVPGHCYGYPGEPAPQGPRVSFMFSEVLGRLLRREGDVATVVG